MTVQLTKKDADGYGLALQGSAPVLVVGVEQGSLAQVGLGMGLEKMTTMFRLQASSRGII